MVKNSSETWSYLLLFYFFFLIPEKSDFDQVVENYGFVPKSRQL